MSSIELKPCPFCGGEVTHLFTNHKNMQRREFMFICKKCETTFFVKASSKYISEEHTENEAAEVWNRRADNKPIRQSCKSCKHYAPDPNYRDGDMGNCRYLEKIWEKPFYVNEARAECEHYQAAERINENGNET